MNAAPAPRPTNRPAILRLPSTAAGRRAARCFGVALAGAALAMALAGLWFGLLEPEGGDIESPPIAFQVPMLLGVLAGAIAALVGAVFAVLALRRGDRSLVLMLPLLAAAWVLFFLGGEFLIGHE